MYQTNSVQKFHCIKCSTSQRVYVSILRCLKFIGRKTLYENILSEMQQLQKYHWKCRPHTRTVFTYYLHYSEHPSTSHKTLIFNIILVYCFYFYISSIQSNSQTNSNRKKQPIHNKDKKYSRDTIQNGNISQQRTNTMRELDRE